MNARLLARGLLILYSIFFMLFAFGEGFSEGGYWHAIPPFIIITALVVFRNKRIVSAVIFLLLSVFSVWFFNTYMDVESFLIISAPLMVAGFLFLFSEKNIIN